MQLSVKTATFHVFDVLYYYANELLIYKSFSIIISTKNIKHTNKIVIPMEHKILILKFIFVFFSKKINETKNSNMINTNEANPIIPSLIPPFILFPTNASKHQIIQDKIYFTIFISFTS